MSTLQADIREAMNAHLNQELYSAYADRRAGLSKLPTPR